MSKLTKEQKVIFSKTVGDQYFSIEVRHDDRSGNGHNTFAITGDIYQAGAYWQGEPRTNRNMIACGCIHEDIEQHFPELAHLIKWHLCSTDGPMHYLANTLYLAGDKDCYSRRKGEPTGNRLVLQFGDFPIKYRDKQEFIKWLANLENYDLEIMTVEHSREPDGYKFEPKYTFLPFGDGVWHQCPFDTEAEAVEFLQALQSSNVTIAREYYGEAEGKEPELEAARATAIWPEATLEQLQDKTALEARLPGLLAEFRAVVESLGMEY